MLKIYPFKNRILSYTLSFYAGEDFQNPLSAVIFQIIHNCRSTDLVNQARAEAKKKNFFVSQTSLLNLAFLKFPKQGLLTLV